MLDADHRRAVALADRQGHREVREGEVRGRGRAYVRRRAPKQGDRIRGSRNGLRHQHLSSRAVKQKRPGLSTRPFANSNWKNQLAFFWGWAVPTFFSIWRFSSSARGERAAALAFRRKASRPPLWSTLLIALVETRSRTF